MRPKKMSPSAPLAGLKSGSMSFPLQDALTMCTRVCAKLLQSCPTLCNPMAPLSMGFSRQEYCSGLACPPPEDLPDPGVEPVSLMSPALASGFFTISAPWEVQWACRFCLIMLAHLSCLLCNKNYS